MRTSSISSVRHAGGVCVGRVAASGTSSVVFSDDVIADGSNRVREKKTMTENMT